MFAPLSENRVMYSVRSTDGSSIMTRHHSCYCNYCIDELYELCVNKEYVDECDIKEVQFEAKSSGAITRSSELDVPEEYTIHFQNWLNVVVWWQRPMISAMILNSSKLQK